jgi:hypothetical protein
MAVTLIAQMQIGLKARRNDGEALPIEVVNQCNNKEKRNDLSLSARGSWYGFRWLGDNRSPQ